MKLRSICRLSLLALAFALACAQGHAQAKGKFVTRDFRVSSIDSSGAVEIDRGTRDRVKIGDVVTFHPLDGRTYRGVVVRLQRRSAFVELHDRTFKPTNGTKGAVRIPRARLTAPKPKPKGKKPVPKKPKPGEKPEFENKDEKYKQGQALLSGLKPVNPADRAVRLQGRSFAIGAIAYDERDEYDNSFIRLGTVATVANPFDRGGEFLVDLEYNHKNELNDKTGSDVAVKELSYIDGGTRFDDARWQFGRFLQYGLPELRILDGVEWSQRRKSGDRMGVSFGYSPEPGEDMRTGADLQFAAHYLVVVGEQEQLTFGGGYQKTFHHLKVDRDLFIGKLTYLPDEGWTAYVTLWVDLYVGKDDLNTSDVELTQAVATLARRYDNGSGVDLTFTRMGIPETLRHESLQLDLNDIADNVYDRLALTSWKVYANRDRLHSKFSGWLDEDDNGGAVEVGYDSIGRDDHLDFTAYANNAKWTTDVGARLTWGSDMGEGSRFDATYDIALHHFQSQLNDRDDLIQHRIRANRSYRLGDRTYLNLNGEARLWDDQWTFTFGFYLQRSF